MAGSEKESLFQPGMYVNGMDASKLMVYVHNENQMIIPNGRTVYGSASTLVNFNLEYCYEVRTFSQVIYITRTHMKTLDQPSQRCGQGNKNINTSACIARFLEDNLGCNSMTIGSQLSKTPKCTTQTQLQALANLSKLLEDGDENDIYEMTGCLAPCIKDQFSLKLDPLKEQIGSPRCEVHFKFIMLDSSYKEEEQYIIYDKDSFIADVGGYMGLLLGSSLLSLYMAMEVCIRKIIRRPLKDKIEA